MTLSKRALTSISDRPATEQSGSHPQVSRSHDRATNASKAPIAQFYDMMRWWANQGFS
jgi:hypothetical protein